MRFFDFAIVGAMLGGIALTAAPGHARAPSVVGTTSATAPGRVEMTDSGPMIVSRDGRSLYSYYLDEGRQGLSPCSNVAQRTEIDMATGLGVIDLVGSDKIKSCTEWFPPYLVADGAKAEGNWGIVKRPEGTRQWTYRKRPLYFSIRDKKPGDRLGEWHKFGLARDVDAVGLPPGLSLGSYGEDLVLISGQKLIFARTGKGACRGECADRFRAIRAPEVARPSGDWSITTAGGQPRQYAFKGKPLFVPAEDLTVRDIEAMGGWQPVVFRKGQALPSAIGKRLNLAGELYTTREGKTLYAYRCRTLLFDDGVPCDGAGEPARHMATLCTDGPTCAARFRPYRAAPGAKPSGAWTIAEITDPPFTDPLGVLYPEDAPKIKVWAFRGSPVYTYYLDTLPRDARGEVRMPGDRKYMTVLTVPGRNLEGGDFPLR